MNRPIQQVIFFSFCDFNSFVIFYLKVNCCIAMKTLNLSCSFVLEVMEQ